MQNLFRAILIAAAVGAALTSAAPAQAQSEIRLVASHPRNEAEVVAPVERVSLAFNQVVDLMSLEIEAEDGAVTVIYDLFETPDSPRQASNFTDDLKTAVTLPGKYFVNYAASATIGKTTSTAAGSVSFTVIDPNAPSADEAGSRASNPD